MYIVAIQNGVTTTEIQNEHHNLFSGSVVKGINTIDSFTFSILPDNPAFGELRDFTTLVSVYNLARQRYEFYGRVLYTSPQMSDKGLITQEAVCESYLGFLCDSQQAYVEEKNWTVRGLLQHILDCHNSQVEPYKHFRLGQVWEDADPNDNLYVGIQYDNSWETIKKNLLDKLGGEIRFRVEGGVNYFDYVESIGEMKETEIALSKNMKSIVKEKNPSSFITRLIPLGVKYSGSEDRLGIAEVNGGKNYIEDAEAVAEYGIHVGYVEFDDVTEADILLTKARQWLTDNNKVSVKYSITALDLSLIGLDVDDFEVGNTHPLKNSLLGIDDTGRINKKNIDVCDETKTSFEIGESFKTLSELQREQMVSVGKLNTDVADIIRNYATNARLNSEITRTFAYIEQLEGRIKIGVTEEGLTEILTGYVTGEGLNTALDGYVTSDGLNDTLGDYATSDGLNNVLGDYVTKTILTEYVKTADLTVTKDNILATVSASYTTKEILNETLGGYMTYAGFKDSLGGYVTENDLDIVLESYVTTASLELKEDAILATVEATYATQSSVNTISGELSLKINKDELVSELNASADVIKITSNRLTIDSDNFTLAVDGSITATNASLNGTFTSKDSYGNVVTVQQGSIVCWHPDELSGDEFITIGGQGIEFNNYSDLGNPFLKLYLSGNLLLGGTKYGVYTLQSDGCLHLEAHYGVGVRSYTDNKIRYLYFNDNGSVTWSTTRPTY